jgi:HSP20 family molecular chaperone IbpA
MPRAVHHHTTTMIHIPPTPTTAQEMATNADQPDPAAEKAAREKEAAEQAALPYTWRQTIADVDISVPVPAGTRGKDLNVVISTNKLTVGLKGKEPIMEVRLPQDIRPY